MSGKTLSDIERDLLIAREALKEAEQRASIARNEETTARNRVNGLQRELDERISSLKKSAPSGTDWHAQYRP